MGSCIGCLGDFPDEKLTFQKASGYYYCPRCWSYMQALKRHIRQEDKVEELEQENARLKKLVDRREKALEEILEILNDPHYRDVPFTVKESKIRKVIKLLWTEGEG